MTISEIYQGQRRIALQEFRGIVADAEILHSEATESLKLRLRLIDGSLIDILHSATGKYSYHWERRMIDGTIYRHDNAPHKRWRGLATFPKHFHNGREDRADPSYLSDDPQAAIREFLTFARDKLAAG